MFHYPGQSVTRHSVYMLYPVPPCISVVYPEAVLFLIPLQSVNLFCNLSQVYPAVLLIYFISVAVILATVFDIYIYIYI